jgi:hypothetical protein
MNTKAAKTAALVLLGFLGIRLMLSTAKPRGIRNNNPLNIRTGDNWQGAIGDDGEFVQFEVVTMGIRAAARILKNYRDKYGLNTVSGIISRWAPPSENDTQSYIASVAGKVGVEANEPLSEVDYTRLISAMIYHENGQQPYSVDEIQQGFEMGFYS